MALETAGALALGRVLRALLFEIRANNPFVLASVAIVLGAAAALACFTPVRRASQIDPAITLRYD